MISAKEIEQLVRRFNFPKFEDWYKSCGSRRWSDKIGDLTCSADKYCWSSECTTYMMAIANCSNPLNDHVRKIFVSTITIENKDNLDSLKLWYETQSTNANECLEYYIIENYFDLGGD